MRSPRKDPEEGGQKMALATTYVSHSLCFKCHIYVTTSKHRSELTPTKENSLEARIVRLKEGFHAVSWDQPDRTKSRSPFSRKLIYSMGVL